MGISSRSIFAALRIKARKVCGRLPAAARTQAQIQKTPLSVAIAAETKSNPSSHTMLLARLFALLTCSLCSSLAIAEPLKLGPLDFVVRVNLIEMPVAVTGSADCNTARGDFNATGELTASIDVPTLRNNAISILKTLLPASLQVSDRNLTIEEISSLEILPHDYEVDLNAKVVASIGSSWFERSKEIAVRINVIPQVINGKKVTWKLVRQPKVDLPTLWWAVMEIKSGDPNQIAGDGIQKWLDENAAFDVPNVSGVRASFQGANFDGDSRIVKFRIKGDGHTDGVGVTSLLETLAKPLNFNFTLKLPPKRNESDLNQKPRT